MATVGKDRCLVPSYLTYLDPQSRDDRYSRHWPAHSIHGIRRKRGLEFCEAVYQAARACDAWAFHDGESWERSLMPARSAARYWAVDWTARSRRRLYSEV